MGTQLPLHQRGRAPLLQFSAHRGLYAVPNRGTDPHFLPMSVVAKRLDGLPLIGVEIGLGPGDCVRWGRSYPQKKGTPHPIFGPYVYCGQNGGMDQGATLPLLW